MNRTFCPTLNDKLADLSLTPNEQSEIDSFEANVTLKKETLRTKLEKRRVTKIQKLLNPGTEQPGSRVDDRPPKRKRNKKRKSQKNNKEGNKSNDKESNQPQPGRNSRPAYTNNNRYREYRRQDRYRDDRRQDRYHDDRGFRPNQYWRDHGYRGGDQRRDWYRDDYGPDQRQDWSRDDREPQYRGHDRYRPRYFEDPPRDNQNYDRSSRGSNRDHQFRGFQNFREEDTDASLTAPDLLRLLVRAGVFRN